MISIIIPTLNEESAIERTLKSLSQLTAIPYEIIISDGKSTDRTLDIARTYTDKIFVHNKPHRQTIAEGRNDGAAMASGDFLLFLDADCHVLDPNAFFTEAMRRFEKEPNLVAMTAYLKFDKETETLTDRIITYLVNQSFRISNNLFRRGASPGEFQLMRRTAFEKVGGFNPKLVTGEDLDMFLRLSRVGRTRFMNDMVVYHTGRRAHKLGWPKLLSIWFANFLSFTILGKAVSREWTPIR